ncbi:MAG: hypothetical protein RI883_1323 [Bacteroidota bacterium]|jgi:uncharacterized protein YcbX
MELEPILSNINIYPIKSLDGVCLEKAVISDGGCLLHDREFALFDEEGNMINGKSNPLVHAIRTKFDFKKETVSFRLKNQTVWNEFHLIIGKLDIENFLTEYFGIKVKIRQNKTGRFLDVPDISGVTVLSVASLETVADWYSIGLDETRKRFRATLEFKGVPAFWEDKLFSSERKMVKLKIGEITLFGMSPRARCVVPTRDSETAKVTKAFPKIFSTKRKLSLPQGSKLQDYGHFYHLSVDCLIPESEIGKTMKVGDKLIIIEELDID